MSATTEPEKSVSKTKPIAYEPNIIMGCDPEFFFKRKGRVIGAERVISLDRKKSPNLWDDPDYKKTNGNIIIDGVQAELNPVAGTCRESNAYRISKLFIELDKQLKVKFKPEEMVSICLDQTVRISKSELAKLDPKNQVFGCSPSFNAYGEEIQLDAVNPLEYRKRSAGGHIHIGTGTQFKNTKDMKNPTEATNRFVRLLDIIVGNTCVLMDRDAGNKERRRMYGRAGEYRLPAHGIEYRVPSNFWLQSYTLMSMVFSLCRFAYAVSKSGQADLFLNAVSEKDVRHAINHNDFNMATKIFSTIEPLLLGTTPEGMTEGAPRILAGPHMKYFKHFIDMIDKNGLEYWFKGDPIENWLKHNTGSRPYSGGESFLAGPVKRDLLRIQNEQKKNSAEASKETPNT